MPTEIFLMIFGFILLIKGGDWFVDASVGIAKKFGLPELLIGATVVAIGTTLPEVLTSVFAAVGGSGGIAYGNAIGSIICNTSLIAALTIAIKPGKVDKSTLIFPVSAFFTVAVFYALNAYIGQGFERWAGILLLLCFVAYMVINVLNMKKGNGAEEKLEIPEELPAEEEPKEKSNFVMDVVMLIVGAATIAIGASLLATNAESVAINYLNMDPVVVGVTIVALGTSLPELVTAITSLMKGHGSLSLGNIIGANIFNLVLVSGTAITIAPFDLPSGLTIGGIPASLIIDIPLVFIVMGIMTIPTIMKGKLSRWQGISLLCIYAAFIASQAILGFM
ncbi:MAG: calcium/sodium antiporter [Clostridia bacterium]|nr:calcium/sodium antiporter [Clostridia bacterium]